MDIRFVWAAGHSKMASGGALVTQHTVDELPGLLDRPDSGVG
jgi:hypothetical protein